MEIEYVNEFEYKDRDSFLKSKRLKNYIKKNNYVYEIVDNYPENKPKNIAVFVYRIRPKED